jgi:hypothetical protein
MSGLSFNEAVGALSARGSIMGVPSYGHRGAMGYMLGQFEPIGGRSGTTYEDDLRKISAIDAQIRKEINTLKAARQRMNDFAYTIDQQYGGLSFRIKNLTSQAVQLSGEVANLITDSEQEYRDLRTRFDSAHTSLAALAAASPTPGDTRGWPPAFQAVLSQIQLRSRELGTLDNELRNIERQVNQIVEEEQRKIREEQDRLSAIEREQQAVQAAQAAQMAQIAAQEQAARDSAAAQAAAQVAAAAAQAEAQAASTQVQVQTQAQIELARIQAEQERQAREDARIAEERALRLQIEQQRLAQEQSMQDVMFQLEQQRLERELAREERQYTKQDEASRLETLLKLAAAGFLQKDQVAQAVSQAVGVPYTPAAPGAIPYQGGPVPPGYQLVDDQTGLPVSPGAASPYGPYPAGGAFSPYGGQQFPYQSAPTFAAPAPAAAPPPVVAPAAPVQAPVQMGVPGIDFGPFSPGAEMFGMGLGASAFSLPPGAVVAPGYAISIMESGDYQATAPDGRTFTMSSSQVNMPGARVADPQSGQVFYTTPAEQSVVDSISNLFGKVIAPVGLTAGDAYLRAKRGESILPQAAPPAGGGGGMGIGTLALGVAAVGAVVVAGVALSGAGKKARK